MHTQVVGIIDHHALQSATIQTKAPLHVHMRPVGSTSTIIAEAFVRHKKAIPKNLAGVLLQVNCARWAAGAAMSQLSMHTRPATR